MPWTSRDAYQHTNKANTPQLQNMWSRVANDRLKAGDDEASAIKQANAVVAKNANKNPKKPSKAPKAKGPPVGGPPVGGGDVAQAPQAMPQMPQMPMPGMGMPPEDQS